MRARFTFLLGLATLPWLSFACGRSTLRVDSRDGCPAGAYCDELTGQGGDLATSVGGAGPGPVGPGGSGGAGGAPTTTVGPGGACGAPTECADGDACTTDVCENGLCQHVARDDDGDGEIAAFCGGGDCNDLNPNVFPGVGENCFDAADNDCNGVADCVDPACTDVPDCGCIPSPGGEACGNGLDDDCDTTVDCNDADCVGTQACGCARAEFACGNGVDEDCNGFIDCDDPACTGDPVCGCLATPEFCGNDADDDCDQLVDCADPDCAGAFGCACSPPGTPEVCTGNADEDCDLLVDCADPDCVFAPTCGSCTTEVCTDGLDNNCDDRIDCADPACFFDPACAPKPEECNNGLDDDNDLLVDCSDPDCANNPKCVLEQANCLSPKLIPASGSYTGDTTGHVSETKGACGGDAGEAVFYFVLTEPSHVRLDTVGTSFDSTLYVRTGKCDAGKEIGCDDDSAGSQWASLLEFPILYPGTYYVFLDGYTVDPDGGANEGAFVLNVDLDPNPTEDCDNGIDDDGDVTVDCADDDCTFTMACGACTPFPPGPEFGPGACTDGLDNDCDGTIDCADEDCSASGYYLTECCDGIDQNDNQIVDEFNCRCRDDFDCPVDQICYTHTDHTCGPPCSAFFGDVCPFVAPGSFCNGATQQCEF